MGTNSFPKELRYLFEDSWRCFLCGMNTASAQHHIVGRGIKGHDEESSILNCAWLCNYKCHIQIHGKLRTEPYVRKMLAINREFLDSVQYELTELDRQFIEKYKKYYD